MKAKTKLWGRFISEFWWTMSKQLRLSFPSNALMVASFDATTFHRVSVNFGSFMCFLHHLAPPISIAFPWVPEVSNLCVHDIMLLVLSGLSKSQKFDVRIIILTKLLSLAPPYISELSDKCFSHHLTPPIYIAFPWVLEVSGLCVHDFGFRDIKIVRIAEIWCSHHFDEAIFSCGTVNFGTFGQVLFASFT